MPCPPKETPSTDDSKLSLTNIAAPTNLDVLCGRGVATNRHVGNESFRALVKRHKVRALSKEPLLNPLLSISILVSSIKSGIKLKVLSLKLI